MGFSWSKTNNPLIEKLLTINTQIIINTGDILLVQASDIEIVLNINIWHSIGIVLTQSLVWYEQQIITFQQFLELDRDVYIRQLHCRRPIGFNRRFERIMKMENNVINTLINMGFVTDTNIVDIQPHHYSSDYPYKRLHLPMYSDNILLQT